MSSPVAPNGTAAVAAAADVLAAADWSRIGGDDAMTALAEIEQLQRRVDAARLSLVEQLDEGHLARAGWASTADFLTHLAGGRRGYGRSVVRLADRLRDLPTTKEAHAAGELSTAQATVIAEQVARLPRVPELRHAVEARLCERAAYADATDLGRAVPEVLREVDPEGHALTGEADLARAERGAHGARFLSFTPDQLGGVRIKGYACVEDVEAVKAALMPLSAPEPSDPCSCQRHGGRRLRRPDEPTRCSSPECAGDGRDRRDFGARLWDGLVEASRRVLSADLAPTTHQASPRLTVTMSLRDLEERLGGRLPDDTSVSGRTARRMACDAEVIPAVLGAAGEILDVGRSRRLVTPGIWNALVARDQHCAFPGCRRLPLACDAHHVVHWADGGETSLDNLVLLCRRHHTITHHTAWTLTVDPDTRRPAWQPPPPLPSEILAQRMTWIARDGTAVGPSLGRASPAA